MNDYSNIIFMMRCQILSYDDSALSRKQGNISFLKAAKKKKMI